MNLKTIQKENWEIKTLGEIAAEIYSGNNGVTGDIKNTGTYPAVKSGDISEINGNTFSKCETFINPELIKNKHSFKFGDILMISQSGSEKVIGRTFLYLGNEYPIPGTGIHVIKHNQNPSYLIHALNTSNIVKKIKNIAKRKHTKGMPLRISIEELKNVKIPLPPRHIQDKIADYLDKFTELSEELKERKKQYEYFRDKIIGRNEEEIEWEIKTLGEISISIKSGQGINKNQLKEFGFPVVRYSEIHGSNLFIKNCISYADEDSIPNKKYCEYGNLLIATHSEDLENAGKSIAYLGNKCLAGQNIKIIKHKENPKYLSYALSSRWCRNQIKRNSKKSTTIYINEQIIEKIKIPLPPLEEQERIVSILDTFHTLCEDIEQGIPVLIEENKKRYEYYRDSIIS